MLAFDEIPFKFTTNNLYFIINTGIRQKLLESDFLSAVTEESFIKIIPLINRLILRRYIRTITVIQKSFFFTLVVKKQL